MLHGPYISTPIFLHFINREMHEALRRTLDTKNMLSILSILSVTHTSTLYCNVSQIYETSYADEVLLNEVLDLALAGVLQVLSPYTSAAEFLSSRQAIYAHDRQRYPMYFRHAPSRLEALPLTSNLALRTTAELAEKFSVWDPIVPHRSGRSFIVHANMSVKELDGFADRIHRVTASRLQEGITFSLYRPYLGEQFGDAATAEFRRILSDAYVDHYVNAFSGAVTLTGLPGFEWYDRSVDFAVFDYTVLRTLLSALGFFDWIGTSNDWRRSERAEHHRSPSHTHFVWTLHSVLRALGSLSKASILSERRAAAIQVIRMFLADRRLPRINGVDYLSFLEQAQQVLQKAALSYGDKDFRFKMAIARVGDVKVKKVLLCTANKNEDDAVLQAFAPLGDATPRSTVGKATVRHFGVYEGVELHHVRSSTGSHGVSGLNTVLSEISAELKPDFVVGVGVCFGLRKAKQNLGDVVVSEFVKPYEPAKLTTSLFGFLPLKQARGEKVPAGATLLDRARDAVMGWKEVSVHFGLVLSGEKLVNQPQFRAQLLAEEPDAIAGEMEGSALVSVCGRNQIEFIIIKGICDWGFDKTDDAQPLAAANAVTVLRRVLSDGRLAR